MDLLDNFLDVSLSEIRHFLGASCYLGDKDKCYILSTLRTYSLIQLIIIIITVRLDFVLDVSLSHCILVLSLRVVFVFLIIKYGVWKDVLTFLSVGLDMKVSQFPE